MENGPLKILLIEDNAGDARLVREHLTDSFGAAQFDLVLSATLAEATEIVHGGNGQKPVLPCDDWDVVLLDLALPDSFGLETLSRWHRQCPTAPTIVLTGHNDEALALTAVREGAQDYLVKGQIDANLLTRSIRYAIERKRTQEALRQAKDSLERRVEERTAELLESNSRLKQEIHEREAAQVQISALLEAEQQARAEVEEANRSKDEFLATLSHELRTPLNAILGWAEIMRTGEPSATELREGIEIIERNARSQARLVEDVLEVSRIICGKLRLNLRTVDLANVIDAALASARPAAQLKHIDLHRDVENGPAMMVRGDIDRLQQVVGNMLSNAIKFTPSRGQVRVGLHRRERDFQIVVQDSGIGIRADFLPYVFDRFRQLDSSSTRAHSGLGLGLSIARHLIEMHGGTIAVASEGDHRGATFTVTLPALTERSMERSGPLAAANALPKLTGIRVLVVEDDLDSRRLLTRLLRRSDAEVRDTASAAEAVEAIEDFEADVLVSDIAMPSEDGYSLMRRLRLSSVPRVRDIPALALSAFARPEDKSRALSAGFQAHLSKPYEPFDLLTLLVELLESSGRRVVDAESTEAPSLATPA